MKKRIFTLLFLSMAFAMVSNAQTTYNVGIGDTLNVFVAQNSDPAGSIYVLPRMEIIDDDRCIREEVEDCRSQLIDVFRWPGNHMNCRIHFEQLPKRNEKRRVNRYVM